MATWREPAVLGVRDGSLDLAGGNLLLARTDLTIETRLGIQAVTQVYNSATDRWTWSFEMSYADGVFRDESGASHRVGGVPAGPIEGTRWRKADAATIESRGGLRFSFAPDGSLARIGWRHAAYPRLELQRPGDGTLRIAQCTAAATCSDVFVVRTAAGQVVEISDRAGRRCRYGYAGGRLAWVETPFEREQGLPPRRYDYALGASGRPSAIVVTNPEQERARYELDPAGRILAWTLVGEESPRWSFGHFPLRTVATDPLGRRTELRFDSARRLLELERAAVGERTTFDWTGRRITRVVGPDGLATTIRYGPEDEPVEWTLASGRRVEAEYAQGLVNLADPWAALPSRVRDGGSLVVERWFDAQGRLASEANGAGERLTLHWGPLETLARVDLPSGLSVRFAEYGEHGKPVEVRLPAVAPGEPEYVERREFDAVGNMTRGSEPGMESGSQHPGVVARTFDAARQLRSLVMSMDAHGAPQDVVLVRRSDGRLRAIQRPYGSSLELDYDAIGRLRAQRERVDGGWAVTRVAWTPAGELARTERPNGMAQELSYDGAGRLARRANLRDGALESEVVYRWAAGRLVEKDDSSTPGPARFHYDAWGRLRVVGWPDREQSWLAYDARDRLTDHVLVDANGQLLRQLGLRYDGAGRERQILDGAEVVYEQGFAAGRLAELRHGNGVVRTLSYDALGRLAGAVSRDAAGRTLETETVVREGRDARGPNPNGPIRETHARYGADTAFGAISLAERAIGYRFGDGRRWVPGFGCDSGTVQWCNGPSCDAAGTLRYFVHSGLLDLDREILPEHADGHRLERLYVRNAERNRLHAIVVRPSWPDAGPASVEHTYSWDAAGFATSRDGVAIRWDANGRLASFGAATFVHDGEGRLRASQVAGIATQRRFGGLVETDAEGRPVRIDLGVVAIELAAGGRSYRHFDWRGNVRSLWDEDGAIRAVREYGAYGLARSHGDAAGDARGFAQGLEVAGLAVLGERIYDAEARQFLSPDPVYGVFHQHVYGAGDPANYWDWTGRKAEETVGFKLAGAFAESTGFAGGFVLGLALGARDRNPITALTLAGTLGAKTGDLSRAWAESVYILAYDWLTAEPPAPPSAPPATGADATHSWFPTNPFELSGPGQPKWVGLGERWTGSELRNQGPQGRPGGGGMMIVPQFGFSFATPSCGLLGAEPLVLLALGIRRRRRAAHAHPPRSSP
jgi:YD repeat-containing protein